MFPLLTLTTPHTTGKHVAAAQWLLKNNRWGQDFMPHTEVNGEYGPHTVAAAMRAKEFLGYRTSDITGSFGAHLYGFLVAKDMPGHLHLPVSYKIRKERRQKRTSTLGAKALAVAQTQIGIKENPPGSNVVKYSQWYGITGPWCAMFVSWCFSQVGGSFHYAYVPYIYADAQAGKNGLSLVKVPELGDLALYTWDPSDPLAHVGFYQEPVAPGEFHDVSGNTGTSNFSNGGEVLQSLRYTSNAAAWVRVVR